MQELWIAVVIEKDVACHFKFVACNVEHGCRELVALEYCLCCLLQFLALFAAETVSVGAEVLIVERECTQCLWVAWEYVLDTLFPVALVVICLHVPAVVCNTVERNLRCLGILHWVAYET